MNGTIGFALLLSALAGFSTTIGSIMALFIRGEPGPRLMTLTLGFSGGVMVFVSFVELLPSSIESIGFLEANLAFFGGMLFMFLIDFLIPHQYMAEEHHPGDGSASPAEVEKSRLLKTGLFVALGLGIHNFPEGMASFATTLSDPNLGIAIAVAIAIHNIPEGLAVSAPVYAATGSRAKAFWWSFLSGAAEPFGALLTALILRPFLNEVILGWMLSIVSGIMVFIALDELVPVSRAYQQEHLSIVGVVGGMIVMSFSLWLLG